ncbi:nucleotide sugar dehydrogenase [Verrucomicrobiales bacterium]|nr:nucleotide sugar dehydrogenase [Verrucomicrobiales bacterium]
MEIAVIGTGYVGLVSGVCLASKNHSVTCFDVNEDIINRLKNGICHIYENGLEEILLSCKSNISFKQLNENTEKNLLDFDAVLVAVGTPTNNGRADLSQIESVARLLGRLIKYSNKYISIIIKSTVIPGTTDTFFRKVLEQESGKTIGDFGLGMNPEFLREGCAVEDFLFPDRIVMGYEDTKTLDILNGIYEPWSCEKIELNTRSAEMMKYVNNSLLATLISTVNEYSNIARTIGDIDFHKVMQGVHLDNRWTPLNAAGQKIRPKIIDYLKPGCGYGGSCFPKDVKAISALAKDVGVPSRILSAVIEVNDKQPEVIIDILKKEVNQLHDKRILMLGLSFKPDTDDVRESVSLKLLNLLTGQVNSISAHDPIAISNAKNVLKSDIKIDFIDDWQSKVPDSDIIIIATNWIQYTELANMPELINGKIILDTRSLLSQLELSNTSYITVN